MPVASGAAAVGEMYALVKAAWDAQAPPVPPMFFEGTTYDTPDGDQEWAVVSVKHFTGRQVTHADAQGQKQESSGGRLFVEIRVPKGTGILRKYALAQVALDALRRPNAADGVWLRDARKQEFDAGGAWDRIDVLAEFSYEELV